MTDSSQHPLRPWTPGPWRVSTAHGLCVVTDRPPALIADMEHKPSGTNANLIALAPEMAEDIIAFETLLRRHRYGHLRQMQQPTERHGGTLATDRGEQ